MIYRTNLYVLTVSTRYTNVFQVYGFGASLWFYPSFLNFSFVNKLSDLMKSVLLVLLTGNVWFVTQKKMLINKCMLPGNASNIDHIPIHGMEETKPGPTPTHTLTHTHSHTHTHIKPGLYL